MSRFRPEFRVTPKLIAYFKMALTFIISTGVIYTVAYLKPVAKDNVDFAKALIWPVFIIFLFTNFGSFFKIIALALISRIERGAEFVVGPIRFGADTRPTIGKSLIDASPNEENLALLHTSFLRPDKTLEFSDGKIYYQFEIIVVGRSAAISQVVKVDYLLENYWSNRDHTSTIMADGFKMKELATADTIVSAKLTIRDREQPLILNRYIDLHKRGRRLRATVW